MAVVCGGRSRIIRGAGRCLDELRGAARKTGARFQRTAAQRCATLSGCYFAMARLVCVPPNSTGKIEVPVILVGEVVKAIAAAVGRKSRDDHLNPLTCPAGIFPGHRTIIGARRSFVERTLWKNCGSAPPP